jgi:NAD(P)-dependent dehydrogenase (short-subunit alcohol dehydrogenase family)
MKHVLITGCSSGIGWACVEAFWQKGFRVTATARRLEDLAEWKGRERISLVRLDVGDAEESERVIREAGTVDVLVNNAGYGQIGALEWVSDEELRRQFEVNVFGLMRLTRAVLPQMRARREGRIIQIGSIVGKFTYPYGGAYCASKHALEALCDALRVEVGSFGVKVVLVQPGPIATRFKSNAEGRSLESLGRGDADYAAMNRRVLDYFKRGGGRGADPARVARVVVGAAMAGRPKSRYVVTLRGKLALALRWMAPDNLWDFIISKAFGVR